MPDETIFVDANVFIDVIRNRKGWEGSLAVLSAVRQENFNGIISTLTAAIVYFNLAGKFSSKQAVHEMLSAVRGFRTIDLSYEDFETATEDDRLEDFEDRLQFYAARKITKICDAQYI
jgi:hypothetical protein